MDLFLCSASPRRSDILNEHNIKFTIIKNKLKDEIKDPKLSPFDQIVNIAYLKSHLSQDSYNGIVLGVDTGIIMDDEFIGKPSDQKDAIQILTRLCGKSHLVVTACCMINTIDQSIDFCIDYAKVTFSISSIETIKSYIDYSQPFDKAGAYGIQDNPPFFKNIEGDLNTVKGLPMNKLLNIFRHYGIVK